MIIINIIIWILFVPIIWAEVNSILLIRSFSFGVSYEKAEPRPAPIYLQLMKVLSILLILTIGILFCLGYYLLTFGAVVLSIMNNEIFKHTISSWLLSEFNKRVLGSTEGGKKPMVRVFYRQQLEIRDLINKLIRRKHGSS